jgi:hypothetical protein
MVRGFQSVTQFKNATEMVIASIEIYCGVFQCLREFLANRAGLLHVVLKIVHPPTCGRHIKRIRN